MPDFQVIDADSHVQEPLTWMHEVAPDLAATLPFDLFADGLALFVLGRPSGGGRSDGETGRLWSTIDRLRPLPMAEASRRLEESEHAWAFTTQTSFEVADRLGRLDRGGIDVQVVNPNLTLNLAAAVARSRPEAYGFLIDAYNSWIIDQTAGSDGRLLPTVLLDFLRPTRLADQLAALAKQGARTFLVPAMEAAGRIVGHVDHDDLWAAAEERQMVGVMHVGYDSVDGGRALPSIGPAPSALAGVVNWSQHVARLQLGLTSLVAGGAFARHGGLRVVVEEFGSSWVAPWIEQLDLAATIGVVRTIAGPWPHDLTPGQLARRTLRIVPLPRDDIENAAQALGSGMLAFGSDHPHSEGWEPDVGDIRRRLSVAPSLDQERFFGDNLRELSR